MIKLSLLGLLALAILGLVIHLTYQPVVKYSAKNFSCSGKTCNVILIVNDTLAAGHLSLYGYGRTTSPFVDEYFGKGGVVFKNMSSNAPWTLASFASFFTSQYPTETKLETYQDRLDPNIPAFPNVLASSGVDVASFYLGEGNSGVFSRFPQKNSFTSEDPLTYDLGIDWIKTHQQKSQNTPFFIMVHNRIVHEPYDPPNQYRKLFGAPEKYPGAVLDTELDQANKDPRGVTKDQHDRFVRQYDQEVRYVDDLTKKFISDLSQEVLDSSLIIFTADHGEGFGEHGVYGHTQSVYQEVLHVPFLVRGPGIKPAIVDASTSLLNLGPTLLDLFGLSKEPTFKGVSLMPVLQGQTFADETVKSELAYRIWPGGTRLDRLPVIRKRQLPDNGWTSVRKGSLKIIEGPTRSFEIYDLSSDPGEKRGLAQNPPAGLDELKQLLPKKF